MSTAPPTIYDDKVPDVRLSKAQKIAMGIVVKRPQTEAMKRRNAAASVRMREMHKMKNDREKQYEAERLAAFQEEYKNRAVSKRDSVEVPQPEAAVEPVVTPKEAKYREVRKFAQPLRHVPAPAPTPAPVPAPAPKQSKSKVKFTPAPMPEALLRIREDEDDSSSDESEYIQRKKKKAEKTIQQIQHLDNALMHATARVNPFTALFMR
jgi:hypothetical protein